MKKNMWKNMGKNISEKKMACSAEKLDLATINDNDDLNPAVSG